MKALPVSAYLSFKASAGAKTAHLLPVRSAYGHTFHTSDTGSAAKGNVAPYHTNIYYIAIVQGYLANALLLCSVLIRGRPPTCVVNILQGVPFSPVARLGRTEGFTGGSKLGHSGPISA